MNKSLFFKFTPLYYERHNVAKNTKHQKDKNGVTETRTNQETKQNRILYVKSNSRKKTYVEIRRYSKLTK